MNTHNQLRSASTLSDTIVENKAGEKIGHIKDLMMDTDTGQVAYAVLQVNTGFLNLGSKLFAIPMQTLVFGNGDEPIVMDISRETLEKAPGFDKDNWPSGPQSDFIDSVYDFYEVQRTDKYASEMASNRNSLSGNAASRHTSDGFRNEGSDLHNQKSYDHRITGNYNKSIH